jgi:hypothetical protein
MPGYIETLLIKFKHPRPSKPRLSPMVLSPSSLQRRMRPSYSTNTVNAEFKKLSARYSTMPERSTTNSW